MNIVSVNIDYLDGDASTYKSIEINFKNKKYRFDSGNITVDWIDMYKWVSDKEYDSLICSSSVNHITSDSNGMIKRIYVNHSNDNEFVDNEEDGLMYICHSSINNFDQHLKYYKENRKS